MRKTRWLFWAIVACLFIGVCVGIGYLARDHRDDSQAEQAMHEAIAETDRLEPNGWQVEDIEAQGSSHAPRIEDDAALTLKTVATSIPRNWPTPPPSPTPAISFAGPLPPGTKKPPKPAELGRFVDRIDLPPEVQMDGVLTADLRNECALIPAATVDLADQLIDQSKGYRKITWKPNALETVNPICDDAHKVADLLQYQALLQMQDGEPDAALRTDCALLGVERCLRFQPLCRGTGSFVRHQAIRSIERTLAQGIPTAETLKKTQAMLEAAVDDPVPVRELRVDRALMIRVCDNLINGSVLLSDITHEDRPKGSLQSTMEMQRTKRMAKCAYPVILRTMNESLKLATLPVEQYKPEVDEWTRRILESEGENDLVDRLLKGEFRHFFGSKKYIQAQLRTTLSALAAERFRQDHKRWPTSSGELTEGKYLSREYLDPYDGKPLRCKTIPEGWIVYSIGPDEIDNDGLLHSSDRMKSADIGFQLWNPERRRQPPAELLPSPNEVFDFEIPEAKQPGNPPASGEH
jgi:hypothetical protein